jgi:hypothetical protein
LSNPPKNAFDRDIAAISAAVTSARVDRNKGLDLARTRFNEGGNTGSYAVLKIKNQYFRRIKAGTKVTGRSVSGDETTGTVLEKTGFFATSLKVKYDVSESQTDYVKCRVGGLENKTIDGCKFLDLIGFHDNIEGRTKIYSIQQSLTF